MVSGRFDRGSNQGRLLLSNLVGALEGISLGAVYAPTSAADCCRRLVQRYLWPGDLKFYDTLNLFNRATSMNNELKLVLPTQKLFATGSGSDVDSELRTKLVGKSEKLETEYVGWQIACIRSFTYQWEELLDYSVSVSDYMIWPVFRVLFRAMPLTNNRDQPSIARSLQLVTNMLVCSSLAAQIIQHDQHMSGTPY